MPDAMSQVRSHVSELQAAIVERLIENLVLNRARIFTAPQENVGRSMSAPSIGSDWTWRLRKPAILVATPGRLGKVLLLASVTEGLPS
jgi:hypothetical protein